MSIANKFNVFPGDHLVDSFLFQLTGIYCSTDFFLTHLVTLPPTGTQAEDIGVTSFTLKWNEVFGKSFSNESLRNTSFLILRRQIKTVMLQALRHITSTCTNQELNW